MYIYRHVSIYVMYIYIYIYNIYSLTATSTGKDIFVASKYVCIRSGSFSLLSVRLYLESAKTIKP